MHKWRDGDRNAGGTSVSFLADRSLQALLVCIASVLLFVACSQKESGGSGRETFFGSVPPFSTIEPERYQAIRTITFRAASQKRQISIARDGPKRRQEYDISGKKIIYLELPEGRYILLPGERLFADLKSEPFAQALEPASPSYIQPGTENRYERLGPEQVGERATMKYSVRSKIEDDGFETLIWVDEALGIPIKSEMRASEVVEVLMELTNISLTVDESAFEIPGDFKLVEWDEILNNLRSAAR